MMSMLRMSTLFRSHGARYSSTVASISGDRKHHHLIVDYLINSLRFSEQDAITLSSKGNLTHLKSTINSDSVLHSLQTYGLNTTQIRQIVSSAPKILTCKADKTLQPKLRAFQQLGLSASDLVNLVRRNPDMFGFGLHTRIIPGLNLLKTLLGNDQNVVQFINKSRWLNCTNYLMKRLSTNVSLLQKLGLSNDRIVMFMLSNPKNVMPNPKLLQSRMDFVENKLGVSHDSRTFIHALCVALYITDEEVEKKIEIFTSFGWSRSDITLLFKNQPYCLNKSDDNIREKLVFYMKDLGYTPSYLIRCHSFFTFSLNKRVIPRNKMLKILKENKLVNDKPSLITVASRSELKFLEFLRGFEDDIPGLCDIYMDSVNRAC
ncbi:hypothetical protein QVD17_07682 [Tagetes erecta]|uniref:Uncharacterized protein n=1 Tax=Tagetes erecta TaxID=13708 RepID=A0AAD8LFH3_TARER|nr:hypothetical protein QVD17_07682 [Tagetes erecta]